MTRTRKFSWTVSGLIFIMISASASAQMIAPPVLAPVPHPLLAANSIRTVSAWNTGVERFGESLASESLRLRGYEVLDSKLSGNKGIDLIAIKRSPDGSLVDVRLVEVKAHSGVGNPKLGVTKDGLQTSRRWFARRLLKLRSRGDEGRQLALEISRFRKASKMPIERLGEVHDINLRYGTYAIRNPVTLTELRRTDIDPAASQ